MWIARRAAGVAAGHAQRSDGGGVTVRLLPCLPLILKAPRVPQFQKRRPAVFRSESGERLDLQNAPARADDADVRLPAPDRNAFARASTPKLAVDHDEALRLKR